MRTIFRALVLVFFLGVALGAGQATISQTTEYFRTLIGVASGAERVKP